MLEDGAPDDAITLRDLLAEWREVDTVGTEDVLGAALRNDPPSLARNTNSKPGQAS